MPDVSVIVPIYKSENTLHRCIDSLIIQTYSDFELILVDDGSPDNSGTICDECSVKDNRIKVIHKNNGGVSSARNAGIDIALGKYICFVDSDDYVEPEYLQEMVSGIEQGYDLVFCGYNNISDNVCRNSTLFSKTEYLETEKRDLSLLCYRTYVSQPWNKIFKKSIIVDNNIRMPEDFSLGEDMIFVFKYLDCIIDKQFLTINKPLYNYCVDDENSLVNKYREDLFDTNARLNDILFAYVQKWDLQNNQIEYFINSCFYRMENVLFNTFRKENKISIAKKLKYNREVLKSEEFQKWYSDFTGHLNFFYKLSYKLKTYLPVLILNSLININKNKGEKNGK